MIGLKLALVANNAAFGVDLTNRVGTYQVCTHAVCSSTKTNSSSVWESKRNATGRTTSKPNLLNQIFVSERFSVAFIKFCPYIARSEVYQTVKMWNLFTYPLSLGCGITSVRGSASHTRRHALNWIKIMYDRTTAVKGFLSRSKRAEHQEELWPANNLPPESHNWNQMNRGNMPAKILLTYYLRFITFAGQGGPSER